MKLSGGAYLAKTLKKIGVKYVFGIPGGQLLPFLDTIRSEEGIQAVTTRHEENAAHMADATSRLTGTIGVCYGTVGPGANNLISGVATAYADGIPLLVITPNNQTFCSYPFTGQLQDQDHENLFKPITKWNAVVRDVTRFPEILKTAVRMAYSGKPGPVHLDIPADIMYKTADFESIEQPFNYLPLEPVKAGSDLIERAFQLLVSAKRPLLLAGGGVVRAGGETDFLNLFKKTGIPATTTPMGSGSIPSNTENFIGDAGWLGGHAVVKALKEADMVLAVGCRFSTWVGSGNPPIMGGSGQKIIQVDISPDHIGRNGDVVLGILSDAKMFLKGLLQHIETEPAALNMEPGWLPDLRKTYENYRSKLDEIVNSPSESIHQGVVAKEVAAFMDDDAIFCPDGGQIMEWAHSYIGVRVPKQRLFVAGMGQLGFGLPFANAAKLHFPDRQVINVVGDGAWGCTMQELETAVRLNLPIINVIANDRAWGMIKLGQLGLYGSCDGVEFSDANYAEIAKGFGAYGERVTKRDDIAPALERAVKSGKPAVIDVICESSVHPVDGNWPMLVMKGCEFPPPPQR